MRNPNEISNHEIERTSSAANFRDINPIKQMSEEEAERFWKSEFSNDADIEKQKIDSYDVLLSEVFNCSEEEIPIKVDIDDHLKSTLDRFLPKHWEQLDEKEKIIAIEDLKESICDVLDLDDEPELKFYEADGEEYGSFNPDDNTININKKHLDNSSELVDTIAHELRHAYQHYRAENPQTHEDLLFKINFENYITPVQLPGGKYLFFTDYYDQLVEVDARKFASQFKEALYERD